MGQVLALASGLSFGFSDFLGGMAARRAPVLSVLAISQPVGLLALLPLLLIARGELSVAAFGIGAAAGAAGTLGLVLYLRALASAAMGIVAPITAVAGASFPVGIGLIVGERPPLPAAIGIILGLAAVVLVAAERARERDGSVARSGVVLAVTAGAAFGLFMVLLHQTPVDSGAWSLIAARLCSVVIVGIGLALLGSGPLPRRSMPIAALSGFLDVGANALFLAASRTVLLSLSALLASLYPVVVVVLARGVLKERLRPTQAAGVAAALVAAGLIAVGAP